MAPAWCAPRRGKRATPNRSRGLSKSNTTMRIPTARRACSDSRRNRCVCTSSTFQLRRISSAMTELMMKRTFHVAWIIGLLLAATSPAADWPQWGGTNERNMYSPEKGLPDKFDPGKFKAGGEEIDMATTKNVKWVAKLGSQSYGNVTISGGKVFVGTNND